MAQNLMESSAMLANQAKKTVKVPAEIFDAIKNAAAKTGVNFSYLMEKASIESGFNADAKAKSSSATGLFQFIESTWLAMVKDHGDKYGLGKYADKIGDNGKVASPAARKEILNLRKDPEVASLMAAEYASGNHDYLKAHVGGDIGSTELYMAHFMGAGGAAGFLSAMKKSPNMTAADLFPKEARANRNVFYDSKTGAPRSLREVYAMFDKKFDGKTGAESVMLANGGTNNMRSRAYAEAEVNNARAMKAVTGENPFTRLAQVMSEGDVIAANSNFNKPSSILRTANADDDRKNWKIFPPSLYGNLSLSPAQMMLLSDFDVG